MLKSCYGIFFILVLTSCASRINLTKVDKEDFNNLVESNRIQKVPGWMACQDDNNVHDASYYYNFYGISLDEVYQHLKYLRASKSFKDGHYSYEQMTTDSDGQKLVTKLDGTANLYDWQITVCDYHQLKQKIKRKGKDSDSRALSVQRRSIVSVKVVPHRVIAWFLENYKISTHKMKYDLDKINEEVKYLGKVVYYCVNDKCSFKRDPNYISSYPVNIVKVYTADFTGGFRLILNYGYIIDSLNKINDDNKLNKFYGKFK